jgi:hypothetical protein
MELYPRRESQNLYTKVVQMKPVCGSVSEYGWSKVITRHEQSTTSCTTEGARSCKREQCESRPRCRCKKPFKQKVVSFLVTRVVILCVGDPSPGSSVGCLPKRLDVSSEQPCIFSTCHVVHVCPAGVDLCISYNALVQLLVYYVHLVPNYT